jgi:hypothetical protein
MKFSLPILGGAALALMLLANSSARADLIPWMYSWSGSPAVIHADAPGKSTITLTDEPLKEAVGDSDIVATNLRTYSTAPATQPDHFTHAAYTLSLYLFDPSVGKGGTLVFNGSFDGTLSSANVDLSNTFTGKTTQTLRFGDHLFTATIVDYTPPGIPGSTNAGSISGHVTITIQTLPEPGTLTLSVLGMVLTGAGRLWRRSRKRAARAAAAGDAP